MLNHLEMSPEKTNNHIKPWWRSKRAWLMRLCLSRSLSSIYNVPISLVFAFKAWITRYKNSKLISKQIPWNASTHKSNLNCNLHGICIGLELEWQCSTLSILYFLSIKINVRGHSQKNNNVIGAESLLFESVSSKQFGACIY